MVITSLDEKHRSVMEKVGPVYVEYIKSGAKFSFEILLMGKGLDFKDEVISAVKTSLKFFGWGGMCNEGFGRGVIEEIEENGFNRFDDYINRISEKIIDEVKDRNEVTLKIVPMMLLERYNGGFYLSTLEDGFLEKLRNSMVERYWQFYKDKHYPPINDVFGDVRRIKIRGWSRKEGKDISFIGMGGQITLRFDELQFEGAKVVAVAKYGIGRWKNQGFGGLLSSSITQ
jgi:CRISPR/Cas system endoribonuclease Cas6 (RAMP superfamily)